VAQLCETCSYPRLGYGAGNGSFQQDGQACASNAGEVVDPTLFDFSGCLEECFAQGQNKRRRPTNFLTKFGAETHRLDISEASGVTTGAGSKYSPPEVDGPCHDQLHKQQAQEEETLSTTDVMSICLLDPGTREICASNPPFEEFLCRLGNGSSEKGKCQLGHVAGNFLARLQWMQVLCGTTQLCFYEPVSCEEQRASIQGEIKFVAGHVVWVISNYTFVSSHSAPRARNPSVACNDTLSMPRQHIPYESQHSSPEHDTDINSLSEGESSVPSHGPLEQARPVSHTFTFHEESADSTFIDYSEMLPSPATRFTNHTPEVAAGMHFVSHDSASFAHPAKRPKPDPCKESEGDLVTVQQQTIDALAAAQVANLQTSMQQEQDPFVGRQVLLVRGKYKGKLAFVERKVHKKYRVAVEGVSWGLEFYPQNFVIHNS